MDRKTENRLSLIKYAAYGGLIWALYGTGGPNSSEALVIGALLVMTGTLRQHVLYNSPREHFVPALFVADLLLVVRLGFLGYQGLDMIVYFLVVSESTIACDKRFTAMFLSATIVGHALTRWPLYERYGPTNWWINLCYNTLGILFAMIVSLIAKSHIEQSAQLRQALKDLARSQQELEVAYTELYASQKRVQELAVLEERTRMAREIHDTLAHTLTAIIVTMEAAKKTLAKGGDVTPHLIKTEEQSRYGLVEVRQSVRNLRDSSLARIGLREAVERSLQQVLPTDAVTVTLDMPAADMVTLEQEAVLFPVIREASTNSVRHGNCTNLTITLVQDRDSLLLTISDNGSAQPDFLPGNGLKGMEERVSGIGGQIDFAVRAQGGFEVRCRIPLVEVSHEQN